MQIPFIFRASTVSNLVTKYGGSQDMRSMLQAFTDKEINMLARYPDLTDEVYRIAIASMADLEDILREDYGLEPVLWEGGDVLVGVSSELDKKVPSWMKSSHSGWVLSAENGEFRAWAQHFFLQEVKVNLWSRYLTHKRTVNKKVPVVEDIYRDHGGYV